MEDDFGFEEIPSLFEEMKSTWEKIIFQNSKTVEVDEPDLQVIRRAFIAAAGYENLNGRWHDANALFLKQNTWSKDKKEVNLRSACRKDAEIMGFIKKGRALKLHPATAREMLEEYTRIDTFFYKGTDGRYYDDDGVGYKMKKTYRKKLLTRLAKKYKFRTPRAVADYLQKHFGLKNLSNLRKHRGRKK